MIVSGRWTTNDAPLPCAGAFHAYCAAVQFDQLFYNCQTQSQAAVLARGTGIGLAEAVEHIGQKLRLNSLSGVGHGDFQMRIHALQHHLHFAPFGRELHGVR